MHFMKIVTPIFNELTFITPIYVYHKKVVCYCCPPKYFEAYLTNRVDPDQTAPVGAV